MIAERRAVFKTLIWSCALLLSAQRLPAQALRADSLFDRLIGHWVLRGTIARLDRFSFQLHRDRSLPHGFRVRPRERFLAVAHGQR
jgi:hypothetical protein